MSRIWKSLLGCFLLVSLASCEKSKDPQSAGGKQGKPIIHTVNYPLLYFTNRLAGNLIEAKFVAPADGDPAFWQPSDEVIADMQKADLIVMNGATYAKWASKASLPTNTQLDTSKAFQANYVTEKGKVTHSHGNGVVHSHDGIAFTTWLDINQAKQQAEAIRAALVKLLPESKNEIETNANQLIADLEAVDQALLAASKKLAEKPLVASHPVYQYLAKRYQLQIKSVHWEPEVVPNEAAMTELKEILANHPAKVMIWEGEPEAESVAKLKALGIESVIFDPCGNRPDSKDADWLLVMKQNIANLNAIGDQ